MSLDDRDVWDERLKNWALWCLRGSKKSVISSIWNLVMSYAGFDQTRDFVPTGTEMDTDKLVRKLPVKFQQAVWAWYVCTGSDQENANDLNISLVTLKARVAEAKIKLDELQQIDRAARRATNNAIHVSTIR